MWKRLLLAAGVSGALAIASYAALAPQPQSRVQSAAPDDRFEQPAAPEFSAAPSRAQYAMDGDMVDASAVRDVRRDRHGRVISFAVAPGAAAGERDAPLS